MIFGMKRDLLLNSLLDLLLEKMKTLRGSISKAAKAEAPPKNPLLGHAALVWGRACLAASPWELEEKGKKRIKKKLERTLL